jgi:hypothetical protein
MRASQDYFATPQVRGHVAPQAAVAPQTARPLDIDDLIPFNSGPSAPTGWAENVNDWFVRQERGCSPMRVRRPGVSFQVAESRSRSPLSDLPVLNNFPLDPHAPAPYGRSGTATPEPIEIVTSDSSSSRSAAASGKAAGTPTLLFRTRSRSRSPLQRPEPHAPVIVYARPPSPAVSFNSRPPTIGSTPSSASVRSFGYPTVVICAPASAHSTLPVTRERASRSSRQIRRRPRSRSPSRRSPSPPPPVLICNTLGRAHSPNRRACRPFEDGLATRGRAGDEVVLADGGRPDIITATAGTAVVRGGKGKPQRPKRARTALADGVVSAA